MRFWKKYVRFDGRASQSEYWFWALWYLIGSASPGIIGSGNVAAVTSPTVRHRTFDRQPLALWACDASRLHRAAVRRLHDVNLSGLLALVFISRRIGILFSCVGLMPSNPPGAAVRPSDRG